MNERAPDIAPEALVLEFVGALRTAGIPVSIHESITFAEALMVVGFTERSQVHLAGRATLVKRAAHRDIYDAVFSAFWDGRDDTAASPDAVPTATAPAPSEPDGPEPDLSRSDPPALDDADHVEHRIDEDVDEVVDEDADEDADPAEEPTEDPADETAPALVLRASAREVLRAKDFARYSDDERDEAHRLLADVRLLGAPRRSRRHRPRPRSGASARVDLARTMRDARRHDGEVIRFRTTTPTTRPRRVVFLLDISGSMETYARPLLRLAQAAATSRGRTRVEVFTMGTRLTRVTRELTFHDPDVALARTAAAVQDWSGGTRLGVDLRRFNDEWGSRGMARGATVVIVSDGWERGDPAVLAEQMQRLARVAHRIVWVNPLKASPGYEPLAQGMAAALPFVDDFVEGHSLDALDDLVRTISGHNESEVR